MSNPADQDKGKRADNFRNPPSAYTIIGLDTDDGPEHPLYDRRVVAMKAAGRAGVASLIDSLLAGQISEINCRKNGPTKEVGVGRRRVYAGRFIEAEGLKPDFMLRTTYHTLTDLQWRARILAENLVRKDSDAFTEALAFADFVKFASIGDLSKLTRLSHKTIDRILALVEMPAEVQKMVVAHNVERDVAIEIATLDTRKQADALRAWLAGPVKTATTARALAEKAQPARSSTAAREPSALRAVTGVEMRRAWKAIDTGKIEAPVPPDAAQLLRALRGEVLPASAPPWLAEILRAMGRE